jgi:hypothetical protein
MNILSQIKYLGKDELVNSIFYQDHITEYPIPNIVDFDWKNMLPNPDKNSSQKTYSELVEVYNKSSNRTKNEIDLIKKIDHNANFLLYEFLDKVNIKFPIDKFEELYRIIKPVLKNVKNYFNRARPYQIDEFYDMKIDVIVTNTHHTPSYPSGHTLYTKLACNIVEDEFPNLRNELNKIVNITANCRIFQGVHFASDNYASISLTNQIYKKLKEKLYG